MQHTVKNNFKSRDLWFFIYISKLRKKINLTICNPYLLINVSQLKFFPNNYYKFKISSLRKKLKALYEDMFDLNNLHICS